MQLELFDDYKEGYLFEDFVETKEMSKIIGHISGFYSKIDAVDISNIIIKGDKFSGKTHLVNFLSIKYKIQIINIFTKLDLANIFMPNKFYIIDDADLIKDDEILLNIINLARESGSYLILLMSNNYISKIKDLNSRLKNFFIKLEIDPPSKETMQDLIFSFFARRQKKISKGKINKLLEAKIVFSYRDLQVILSDF